MCAAPAADRRSLWYGTPGSDDSRRSTDEIRIIREMVAEEVELFLQSNAIDSAAAKELRNEAPHVQLAVLERGPLRACTNPSGALVARIRDAKRGILGDRGRYGGAPAPSTLDPNASELDKFLAENRIDQAGIASIRCESREVQRAVMARGPLVNTTNPSASLMARIRTVKQEPQGGAGGAGGAGMGTGAGAGIPSLAALMAAETFPQLPALALEDSRPGGAQTNIASSALNEEALRAIQKLSASVVAGVTQQLEAPGWTPGGGGEGADGGSGQAITNNEDKRLQDEALRAIQTLNARDL